MRGNRETLEIHPSRYCLPNDLVQIPDTRVIEFCERFGIAVPINEKVLYRVSHTLPTHSAPATPRSSPRDPLTAS